MIEISHCKINLGLDILERRSDGFHEISTIMYPIGGVGDVVEIMPSERNQFTQSGLTIDCHPTENLCVRALELMQSLLDIPPTHIYLHKTIPMGAGLGAGSANATAVLKLCNDQYRLGLKTDELEKLAAKLGSDTPFFVKNRPAYATGRGEIMTPIKLDLKPYYIYIVKPPVGVSTKEAYAGVTPHTPKIPATQIIQQPIEQWKKLLVNNFEKSIFKKLPQLADIKQQLYNAGALYASMSGSGAALYGIFPNKISTNLPYFYHLEEPKKP